MSLEKLKIRVKPGANRYKIEKMSDGTFKISVREPAKKGRANKDLLKFLREVTGVRVTLEAGSKSKSKLIGFTCSEYEFRKKLESYIRKNAKN